MTTQAARAADAAVHVDPTTLDDPLDWPGQGFSARTRAVVIAIAEAILCDEDDTHALVAPNRALCERAVDGFDHSVGRGSTDVRRGFAVMSFVIEWLPLFVIGVFGRMSRLPLERRVAYLERLESSKVGLLTMLMVAFKVPLCIPAFEDEELLGDTGFDRPSTAARRRLPMAGAA